MIYDKGGRKYSGYFGVLPAAQRMRGMIFFPWRL